MVLAHSRNRGITNKPTGAGTKFTVYGDSISDPQAVVGATQQGGWRALLAAKYGWTEVGRGSGATSGTPATLGTPTIAGGAVTGCPVASGGAGYTASTNIAVTFTGGGGSGAVGRATAAGGVVTGVTIAAGGAGYTTAPTGVLGAVLDANRSAIASTLLEDSAGSTMIAARLTAYAADVVAIHYTANDFNAAQTTPASYNPGNYKTQLQTIVTAVAAQANHPLIVLLGPEPIGFLWSTIPTFAAPFGTPASRDAGLAMFNDAIRQVAFENANCLYVSLANMDLNAMGATAGDIHLNTTGFQFIADRVADALAGF